MAFVRFCAVFIFIFSNLICIYSQNFSLFKSSEDSIRSLFCQIKNNNNDSAKLYLNHKVCSVFENLLIYSESFSFPFDSLPQFGKLESPDKLFRIITWNIILIDGSYSYYGIIQIKNQKTGAIQLFSLTDRASEITKRENSVLSAGKWYGGLYYKIIKNKINQTTYYTLLSLRYNDLFTTSKIIDILYFDEFGNPVFGAPLFTDGKKTKLRVVFEYSANVAMNLNYDETLKMIVFDHLSASDSRFVGEFEYYGPDFSYDGYLFKSNGWKLIPDLDIKRQSGSKTISPKRIPGSNKVGR